MILGGPPEGGSGGGDDLMGNEGGRDQEDEGRSPDEATGTFPDRLGPSCPPLTCCWQQWMQRVLPLHLML